MKFIMVTVLIVFCTKVNAQKNNKKESVHFLEMILNRVYFGNLDYMVMYRKQTIDYLISDKKDKTLMTGFIKSSIKVNTTFRFIIQNEYMYEINKMNMCFNTPSVGFRKYF